MKFRLFLRVLVIIGMLHVGVAAAAPIHYNAFDGGWLPAGSKALMGYYGSYGGDTLYAEGEKAIENIDFSVNVGILRFSMWEELGLPIQAHFVLPFGRKNIAYQHPLAGAVRQTASGFSDPEVDVAFQPLSWGSGSMGLGLAAIAPFGTTSSADNFNMSDNRWTLRPMFNIGQNFNSRWHIDWWLCYDFYTDNGDYLSATGDKATLEKEGALFTELHISYAIVPESRTTLSLSFGGMWGGEESVAGTVTTTAMKDYAVKAGFSTMITPTVAINYTLTYDIAIENGPRSYQNMIRFTQYF